MSRIKKKKRTKRNYSYTKSASKIYIAKQFWNNKWICHNWWLNLWICQWNISRS
jgi:hypothetical protein